MAVVSMLGFVGKMAYIIFDWYQHSHKMLQKKRNLQSIPWVKLQAALLLPKLVDKVYKDLKIILTIK